MTDSIDRTVFKELQAAAGAEFVVELVDTFFEEAPTLLADLRSALAQGDADRFRRAAHSLKSNSLTFGASALAELARALELGGLPTDATNPTRAAQALDAIDTLAAAYAVAAQDLKNLRHG